MRPAATLLLCLLLWLPMIGCSHKSADHPQSSASTPNDSLVGSTSSNSEPSVAGPTSLRSSDRFPRDQTIGVWVEDDTIIGLISFNDVTFQPMWPVPDEGYVPIEAMGHTLSTKLHNGTSRRLANIEVKVTATSRETGKTLAELTTKSVIPYFIVAPGETLERKIELTFGVNGEDQSPFAKADSWPEFDVSVGVLRARLIE